MSGVDVSHILKSERGRRLEFGEESGTGSKQVSSVRGRLSAGFSPRSLLAKRTQINSCWTTTTRPVSQQRVAMELSSIGDQVFAVESITKKRVRKVRRPFRGTLSASRRFPQLVPRLRSSVSAELAHLRPRGAPKLGYAVPPPPPIRPLTTGTFDAVKTCQTSVAFSRLRSLPVQPAAPRRRGYAVRVKWEKEACVCVCI